MAERVARVAQEYAGRRILPGEKFHVDPLHERLLEAIGRIEPLTTATASRETRGMTAAQPATYRTRDMAADPAPKKRRNRKSLVGRARA